MENNTFDQEIFKGKTFSDLLKEIHKKSNDRSNQIRLLIDELRPLVKNIGDATVIVPLIKDYLDVDVKNTELLVKISVVIQRHLTKSSGPSAGDFDLTVEEIEQLMEEDKQQTKATEQIKDKIDEIKPKDNKKESSDDFDLLMES